MEMNVIETNQYFLQKDFVLQVQIWHKKGPNELWKCKKKGVNTGEVLYYLQLWECPPPPGSEYTQLNAQDSVNSDKL